MANYWKIFTDTYAGYANYLWHEITHPSWTNYFYWLIGVSLFFFALEIIIPWRKKQPIFRKDFWLDAFYMFFNFFLFSLIIYQAAASVVVQFFNNSLIAITGFDLQAINPIHDWPYWLVLLTGFIFRDFIQWWTHRLLHSVEWLWRFHQVHHSVEQMGFAAQLRYHWMENIVYNSILYIPMAFMGYDLVDFFIIHIMAFTWGHFNHANITINPRITGGILGLLLGIVVSNNLLDITLFQDSSTTIKMLVIVASTAIGAFAIGPFMRILFNSPEMHIWHHAYDLPDNHPHGVNFGLTLAIWDYIFGTAYVPESGRDIRLGFHDIEHFPQDFVQQNLYGIIPQKKEDTHK